jgi:hypothetical protein
LGKFSRRRKQQNIEAKQQRFEYGALPASEKDNAETQSTQSSEEKRKPGGLA